MDECEQNAVAKWSKRVAEDIEEPSGLAKESGEFRNQRIHVLRFIQHLAPVLGCFEDTGGCQITEWPLETRRRHSETPRKLTAVNRVVP